METCNSTLCACVGGSLEKPITTTLACLPAEEDEASRLQPPMSPMPPRLGITTT